jgi:hypothetical protein
MTMRTGKLRPVVALLAGLAWGPTAQAGPRGIAVEAVNPMPSFAVRVDVGRADRTYKEGAELHVRVRSQKAGHLYLFYIDAGEKVSCIFPNVLQPDNRIAAETNVAVPAPAAAFRFRIRAPFGREVLKAVVTQRPIAALSIKELTKANATPITPAQFKSIFTDRGVEVEPVSGRVRYRPECRHKYREWAEHHVVIWTRAADATPPPRAARRVGVFIGISKFQDRKIRPLRVGDKDAVRMAAVMKAEGKLDEAVLLLDEKATLAAIEEQVLRRLPAATRPGDLVVLYWSGHGGQMASADGVGLDEFLVPYDGRLGAADTLRSTMLLDKTFGRWVQALDGRKVIVILDACHAGGHAAGTPKAAKGTARGFFEKALGYMREIDQKEAAVLASSLSSEVSYERREADLSVMTFFLVEKLRAGGPVTLTAAFDHVKVKVPVYMRERFPGRTQTPVLMDRTTPPVYLRP